MVTSLPQDLYFDVSFSSDFCMNDSGIRHALLLCSYKGVCVHSSGS